uniref:3-hydroxyisobutyryl-CoA hydrolase, mitochondrial n=1 Tax=Globodera rostochiensis TaxID=31243 RepID=A0A914I095_GLORO
MQPRPRVTREDGSVIEEQKDEKGDFNIVFRSDENENNENSGKFNPSKRMLKGRGYVVDFAPDLQVSNVSEGIYLSSQDVAQDLSLLQRHGITHILKLLDVPSDDLKKHFPRVQQFMRKAIEKKGKVLVHCNAGISRSSALVLAYIMRFEGHSLGDALVRVREQRPTTSENWESRAEIHHKTHCMANVSTNSSFNEDSKRIRSFHQKHSPMLTKHGAKLNAMVNDLVLQPMKQTTDMETDANAGPGEGGGAVSSSTFEPELSAFDDMAQEHKHPIHHLISRCGKAIDTRFFSDLSRLLKNEKQIEQNPDNLRHANRLILEHLMGLGRTQVADVFLQEAEMSSLDVPDIDNFGALKSIMSSFKQHDYLPAIQWVKEQWGDGTDRHDLLFRLQCQHVIRLLETSGKRQALCYVKEMQNEEKEKYKEELKHMMFVVMTHPQKGPHDYLFNEGRRFALERELANAITNYRSSLAKILNAGAKTVPSLMTLRAFLNTSRGGMATLPDELPCNVPVPEQVHSSFCCPILKVQSTEDNPPVRLSCGHVISTEAMQKLAQQSRNNRLKCPYCPLESVLQECKMIFHAICLRGSLPLSLYASRSVSIRPFCALADGDVLLERINRKLIITLNRPKALNALSLPMIRKIYPELRNSTFDLVLVKGKGKKAFCAGGDVVAVSKSYKANNPLDRTFEQFFLEEYRLNHLIGCLSRPYVAFIDGFTMGGGCGLSMHGPFRVATERTVLAMPETALGLFPDVGGTHFLSRLSGQLGMFLALTGYRLHGADVYHAGLATHYVESANLQRVQDELFVLSSPKCSDIDQLLRSHGPSDVASFVLDPHLAMIDECFAADSVEGIVERLSQRADDEFAQEQLTVLAKMSPTSLKVTFRQIRMGAKLKFEEVFPMEYRLTQRFIAAHDFHEGCRAILIDKDRNPKWRPSELSDVDEAVVDAYFAPFDIAEKELKLEKISSV